ncbi:MAG: lipopolysaccharide biosynthesis protein [Bacteroidales bacterium]|jgi:PST family polysaccharide transporter
MNSIKKEMASGVYYTALAKYSGVILSLVIAGILSRILTSDDFGVIAIATVIIAFFSIFSDLGIAPSIIQKKDLTNDDFNNIFSFTIWSGIIISILFFLSSWLIADFFNSEILIPVCQLLSINLLFASVNIVPNALLQKAKRFKFIAVRTLGVQVVCGIVSIIAAYKGAGVYALLINPILSSIILFIVNYFQYKIQLKFTLGLSSIKKIFSYSAYQFGFNIINYFSRNLDKLLIGKHLNMSELGFYDKSYRMMMLPLQVLPQVVSPVMHPIFSDLQNDLKKLSESYLKVVKLLAFIGLPISVFLLFTAYELIILVFGHQWEPSVPVFKVLSLSVGLQVILSTSGSIFQAANSTKTLFWCGLITTILNILAICIGLFCFNTSYAIAWGICISFTLNFIITYYLMYNKVFKISWKPFWKILISPVILSGILGCMLFLLNIILPSDLNLILSLIIKGILALVIWLGYIQISGEYDIRKIVTYLLNKKKNK